MKEAAVQPASFLAILLGLGLAFQVGHFFEHAVQFAVWVSGNYQWVIVNFCGPGAPYMSPPATEVVRFLGAHLFAGDPPARQMIMGMEILHLIGNAIFLATIAGVLCLFPVRLVRYALYIEGAHMCEHVSLTISTYLIGKSIGLSTLFGHAQSLWGIEAAVGWRVTFHFVMNLLPMPFVMVALMQQWSAAGASTDANHPGHREDVTWRLTDRFTRSPTTSDVCACFPTTLPASMIGSRQSVNHRNSGRELRDGHV